jgi:hypothetical protein
VINDIRNSEKYEKKIAKFALPLKKNLMMQWTENKPLVLPLVKITLTITMLVCLSLSQAVAQDTDITPKSRRDKWGYVNSKGKKAIDYKYQKASPFNTEIEGLARVQLNNKWGFIDKTGKEASPCKYASFDEFSNDGLAKVQLYAKWGYIDKTGKEVIPCIYDAIDAFVSRGPSDSTTRAEVWIDGKYGRIDRNGREIVPLKYESKRMEAIWENLLIPHLKQINAYKSEFFFSNSTGGDRIRPNTHTTYLHFLERWGPAFTIKRPYLLVSTNKRQKYLMEFSDYSEDVFGEHSANDVKTLIVQYYYFEDSAEYKPLTGIALSVSASSYGSFLVYFDVESKECVGFDRVVGSLPRTVSVSEDIYRNRIVNDNVTYNSIREIVQIIKMRLAAPIE